MRTREDEDEVDMGGVDHCSLHCRLAKFRGLMRRGKYGAVIGHKTRFLYVPSMNYQAMGSFSANHSAVFPPSHQTRELRQATVETTVVDPSHRYAC